MVSRCNQYNQPLSVPIIDIHEEVLAQQLVKAYVENIIPQRVISLSDPDIISTRWSDIAFERMWKSWEKFSDSHPRTIRVLNVFSPFTLVSVLMAVDKYFKK